MAIARQRTVSVTMTLVGGYGIVLEDFLPLFNTNSDVVILLSSLKIKSSHLVMTMQ
jgi:hypothetical protein